MQMTNYAKKLKYQLSLRDMPYDTIEHDYVDHVTIKDGFLLIYSRGVLSDVHPTSNVLRLKLIR